MGLPSAQLGSLPSMNVPSSVPVVGVQKTPKIWEQALLGLLTQAAGSAVQQGIGNVMAQDYAEEPSTGWQKLLKGPKMDKQQKMQQTSLSAASTEAEKGRTFTKGENELSRGLTKSEAELSRKQAAQLAEQERALRNHLAAADRMGAMERLIAGGQQQKDSLEFSDTLAGARAREQYNLGVMDPQSIAKTKLLEAEVLKTQQGVEQQKALQALLSGKGNTSGQTPGGSQPTAPFQSAIGDGKGLFPQASDALASLMLALQNGDKPSAQTVPPVDAGVPSPYIAMRLGQQPVRENNMVAPTPDASEQQVLQGAPYSVRAQEIRRKYGLPQ